MKNIPVILMLLVACSLNLVSCDPDEDDNSTTDPREKFVGTWTVQENKKKVTYEVQVSNDPSNSAQVLINNFYNVGIKPFAVVTSSTITVPVQSFTTQGLQVNGSGNYSSNKITWVYYVNDGADLDTINATYTKN